MFKKQQSLILQRIILILYGIICCNIDLKSMMTSFCPSTECFVQQLKKVHGIKLKYLIEKAFSCPCNENVIANKIHSVYCNCFCPGFRNKKKSHTQTAACKLCRCHCCCCCDANCHHYHHRQRSCRQRRRWQWHIGPTNKHL